MKTWKILYGVAGAFFGSMTAGYLGKRFYNLSKEEKIKLINKFVPLFKKILNDIYEYWEKSTSKEESEVK